LTEKKKRKSLAAAQWGGGGAYKGNISLKKELKELTQEGGATVFPGGTSKDFGRGGYVLFLPLKKGKKTWGERSKNNINHHHRTPTPKRQLRPTGILEKGQTRARRVAIEGDGVLEKADRPPLSHTKSELCGTDTWKEPGKSIRQENRKPRQVYSGPLYKTGNTKQEIFNSC